MTWSRLAGRFAGGRPLVLSVVLVAGCSSAPQPVDPRTPEALAAPTPVEWRAAAAAVAAEIAAALEARGAPTAVSLRPFAGAATPGQASDPTLASLPDTLVAELVRAGVPVAVEGRSLLALHCRIAASGTTARPRGVLATVADPTAETVLLCLLADGGRYVAAARSILRPHAPQAPAPQGVVLEITG